LEPAFEFFRKAFFIMSGVFIICAFTSLLLPQDLRDEWFPILLTMAVLNIIISSFLNNVKNREDESETWKVGEVKQ